MTTTEPTLLPVEQCDRDAAAGFKPGMFDYITDGKCDHWSIVQAFAAHRLAAQSSPGRDGVIEEIAAERFRQSKAEGWTPEHDDEHSDGSLAIAAACYAAPDRVKATTDYERRHGVPVDYANALRWPWESDPKFKDQRSNLIRSAALIVAEIERIDRALSANDTQPRDERDGS